MDYKADELVKQITGMTIERWFFRPDLFFRNEKTKTTILPDGTVTCVHYVRTDIGSRLKKGKVTNWSVDPKEVRKACEKAASFLFRPTKVVEFVDDAAGMITLHLGEIRIDIPRGATCGEDDLYSLFWAFPEPEESKQEG